MTRRARALFFTALAAFLAPFAVSDGAPAGAGAATPGMAPAPVEQEAYPASWAPRTVVPDPPAERLAETLPPPTASAESPVANRVVVSRGVAHPTVPGAAPLRPHHPSRAPPPIS